MMMGTLEILRSSRVTSSPSMCGRPRSRTIKSGFSVRASDRRIFRRRPRNGKTGAFEVIAHHFDDFGFVVDDKDGFHFEKFSRGRRLTTTTV